jgi:Cu/Ag efflux pump CusA
MRLWETHEYLVKPTLRTAQGVAEINNNGGHRRILAVEPDLAKLQAANLTVRDLAQILRGNVENSGGGVVQRNGEQLTIRSVGHVSSAEEIAALPVKFGATVQPITVGDVASVHWGTPFRGGAATMDGEEVVLGTVMMLLGQNAKNVCGRVAPRIDEVREKLPKGMDLTVVYDRADLVQSTIRTVAKNLAEGAVFVVVVLLALLGNWRAALIVAAAIPLSFLFAITGMVQGGWSGNLMSLGAVDFGLIIDCAMVMVENIVSRIGTRQHHLWRILTPEKRTSEVLVASRQVARPMFFGVLVITIVYLPILALDGVEGTKAELALLIYGSEYETLESLASKIRDIINQTPGGSAELETDGRTSSLVLTPKREVLSKYNLPLSEINRAVSTALGGDVVGQIVDGNRKRDVVVRLPEDFRNRDEVIRSIPLRVGESGLMLLGQAVDVSVEKTVEPIRHSRTQRRAALLVSIAKGRDMEGFVKEATETIRKEVHFPEGYSFEFGGSFENLQEARSRLAVVVPSALVLIMALIFLAFNSLSQTLLVATSIPLALTGGVLALWLRQMPFSITAAVGFIALSGVAVLNALVLVNYFNDLREEGVPIEEAVLRGVAARLRLVLMTALVAALGFVPMALAHGAGAEVQRLLATVVIGGILSSTNLTLFVLPVLYAWSEERSQKSLLPDSGAAV